MAVEYHVATFFYDGVIKNRWGRTVGLRAHPRTQSVEEFMEMVSESWANAEVISVTETADRMTVIMRADRFDDDDNEE